jgi:UDP-GlcNAc:undecaprenyl-phosphate/decaprenyl-phosphate GlcNAc-1-phosphate transferase
MPVIAISAVLFITALACALVLTPVVRQRAHKYGVVDHPDGQRKLHSTPIPRLGGIAVFCAFYLTIAFFLPLINNPVARFASDLATRTFVPSVAILLLGVADDLWNVRPWTKIAVQVLAGAWICWYPDLRIAFLWHPFGLTEGAVGAFSIPLTLAWIILITNAFNIVDGMDGLASGVAFVATTCLFVASIQRPDAFAPLLVAPLAGALLGFLRYNFNPASIFLGDSGSLWLGFQIAVLSIASQNKSSTAVAVASPLLSLALPLIETSVSTVRRFLRGQPIWQPDAGHIHHQLLKQGISARQAAIVLYAASGLFGAASLLVGDANDSTRTLGGVITLALVALSWLGIQNLGYSEFAEVNHAFRRGFLYQRRIIQNNILIRKLLDDLRGEEQMERAWPLLVQVVDQLAFSRMDLATDEPGRLRKAWDHDVIRSWTSEERYQVQGDWSIISVHLVSEGRPLGRVDLWRSRQEPPLHSELPALLDVIAEQLPRLLPARPLVGVGFPA